MVMDQVFGMDGDHGQCLWGCLMVMDNIFGKVWWSWILFLGMFDGHGPSFWDGW